MIALATGRVGGACDEAIRSSATAPGTCPGTRARSRPPMIAFFSNRLGCMGSLLVSVIGTAFLLLVLGVLD